MGDNFNENLRDAREQKGLSQKEVAEKIGVAKSTYSLYESGNREPNVQIIILSRSGPWSCFEYFN